MALLALLGWSARQGVRVAKLEAFRAASRSGGGAIGEGPWASITAACVSDRRGGGLVQGAPMPLTASGGGACQGGQVAKVVHLESCGEG